MRKHSLMLITHRLALFLPYTQIIFTDSHPILSSHRSHSAFRKTKTKLMLYHLSPRILHNARQNNGHQNLSYIRISLLLCSQHNVRWRLSHIFSHRSCNALKNNNNVSTFCIHLLALLLQCIKHNVYWRLPIYLFAPFLWCTHKNNNNIHQRSAYIALHCSYHAANTTSTDVCHIYLSRIIPMTHLKNNNNAHQHSAYIALLCF